MIEKTIEIDGKPVRFRSSAAVPLMYRVKFGGDIIVDMQKLAESMEKQQETAKKKARAKGENLSKKEAAEAAYTAIDLQLFLRVAYVFAYCADRTIPADLYDWLDQFEMFSIHAILPELMELWNVNSMGQSTPKKK